MIVDPHVHLRDWDEKGKETLYHGLETALLCGVGAVFDMPNCSPPLVGEAAVLRRLEDARAASIRLSADRGGAPVPFYAIYGGLTAEEKQIREIVGLHRRLFPSVAGLKLFAGKSTGGLAVSGTDEQRRVWEILAESGYTGVVAVHCEKEELFRPELWDSRIPASHSLARPEEAERASAADQIAFASDACFRGTLHICHISAPETLELVRVFRAEKGKHSFRISCGATPHHLLLDSSMVPDGPEGLLLKVNPPLRGRKSRQSLLAALFDGTVDWIESDHAPHTPRDKSAAYASGLPSLTAWPLLLSRLRFMGMSEEMLQRVSGHRVLEVFGMHPVSALEADSAAEAAEKVSGITDRYPANGWHILDPDPAAGTD
jgi:dihydroorotase